jgi:hypothetical protein
MSTILARDDEPRSLFRAFEEVGLVGLPGLPGSERPIFSRPP